MIIRTARIPIIKLVTGPASGDVVADVSLGDDSGPAAARYVTQQIAAYPPLAPLVLVLKARPGSARRAAAGAFGLRAARGRALAGGSGARRAGRLRLRCRPRRRAGRAAAEGEFAPYTGAGKPVETCAAAGPAAPSLSSSPCSPFLRRPPTKP
jgi:hypothetical protein